MNGKKAMELVDTLMKKQHIKFSVACRAYKLIRRGMSVDAALVIANAREGKEGQRQQQKDKGMKRKNEKSLEELVEAEVASFRGFKELTMEQMKILSYGRDCSREWDIAQAMKWRDDYCGPEDAMNFARPLHLDAGSKSDALDYCYSNTDGAEELFK